jgi:hypothetical protein
MVINNDTVNSKSYTITISGGSNTSSSTEYTISAGSYQTLCGNGNNVYQQESTGSLPTGSRSTSIKVNPSITSSGLFTTVTGTTEYTASSNCSSGANWYDIIMTADTANTGNSITISSNYKASMSCDGLTVNIYNKDIEPKTYTYNFTGTSTVSGTRTLCPMMLDSWTCPKEETMNNFTVSPSFIL